MTANGRGMPLMTKNSRVLSSMAESDPVAFTTGSTLYRSSPSAPLSMVSSRASILSPLPRIVLISPLCTMKRLGCARSQLGLVLVLNREWTMAMADS